MYDSKTCFKCEVHKPLIDFYKHPRMPDGYVNKCKECNKKDVRDNRLKKIDYYLEYDKCRANNPDRIKGRFKYANSDKGKETSSAAKLRWTESNLIKRAAHIMVGNAVSNGEILKPLVCEICFTTPSRLHGHHDDYAYPLSVRWLCSKCHCAWHKINGAGINS